MVAEGGTHRAKGDLRIKFNANDSPLKRLIVLLNNLASASGVTFFPPDLRSTGDAAARAPFCPTFPDSPQSSERCKLSWGLEYLDDQIASVTVVEEMFSLLP